MARSPLKIPMNIGGGNTVQVSVPRAIIDYFGVTIPTTADTAPVLRERKPHLRKRYNRDDINAPVSGSSTAVGAARWWDTRNSRAKRGQGKLIKIPTEVLYDAANPSKGFRHVSMRVPSAATNYVIAQFINTKFTTKKPLYFLTQSGDQYPVNVPTQADPNPGQGDATAPAA